MPASCPGLFREMSDQLSVPGSLERRAAWLDPVQAYVIPDGTPSLIPGPPARFLFMHKGSAQPVRPVAARDLLRSTFARLPFMMIPNSPGLTQISRV